MSSPHEFKKPIVAGNLVSRTRVGQHEFFGIVSDEGGVFAPYVVLELISNHTVFLIHPIMREIAVYRGPSYNSHAEARAALDSCLAARGKRPSARRIRRAVCRDFATAHRIEEPQNKDCEYSIECEGPRFSLLVNRAYLGNVSVAITRPNADSRLSPPMILSLVETRLPLPPAVLRAQYEGDATPAMKRAVLRAARSPSKENAKETNAFIDAILANEAERPFWADALQALDLNEVYGSTAFLVGLLDDSDPNLRERALRIVDSLDTSDALECAERALIDPDPRVRKRALKVASSRLRGITSRVARVAFSDEDPSVRSTGRAVLRRLVSL